MAEDKTLETSSCCGGPVPEGADACCVKDADAKAAGQPGCGCGPAASEGRVPVAAASCCN